MYYRVIFVKFNCDNMTTFTGIFFGFEFHLKIISGLIYFSQINSSASPVFLNPYLCFTFLIRNCIFSFCSIELQCVVIRLSSVIITSLIFPGYTAGSVIKWVYWYYFLYLAIIGLNLCRLYDTDKRILSAHQP